MMQDSNNSNILCLSPEQLQNIVSNAVAAATQVVTRNSAPQASSRAEKPKRPIITAGTTAEKWSYFQTRWTRYKGLANIPNEELANHLLECCDEDLQLALHRAIGPGISQKTE